MDVFKYLSETDLFDNLDPTIIKRLADSSQIISLNKDDTLFKQNENSHDGMYILINGRLQVQMTASDDTLLIVGEIAEGKPVGEIASLTGERRTATVIALKNSNLIRIPKDILDQILQQFPSVGNMLSKTIIRRLRRNQLAEVLHTLFEVADKETLYDLEEVVTWLTLKSGECLFEQNQVGDSLYIVLHGRLNVIVEDQEGNKRVIGEIAPGETAGEMSLFTGEKRTASVYAIRETTVVKLTKIDFDHVLEQHPKSSLAITRMIIQRLQKSIHELPHKSTVTNFMLINVGGDINLTQVAEKLTQSLSKMGPTLHLNRSIVEKKLNIPNVNLVKEDTPEFIKLTTWTNEIEMHHQFIIYEADNKPTSWTHRCTQNADRILLVADAEAEPSYDLLSNSNIRKDLILLQPDSIKYPKGTLKWLQALRPIHRHYHIRLNEEKGFDKIARFLSGRAIGLVLGGGGARGFAHAGVLRALEELGITVDCIGGTSMGALIAGTYALGWDYEYTLIQCLKMYRPRTFCDITFPFVALFRGRRLKKMLLQLFDEVEIEDTWCEYFCVSSNLTKACEVIHRTGPLWRSIRTSISIPAVYPPILENGDILADGRILNNMPTDIMDNICEGGPVIGIDVSKPVDLQEMVQLRSSLSGWKTLLKKLNPFSKSLKVPNILDILMRSSELSEIRRKENRFKIADLPISLPVQDYGAFDYKYCKELIDLGYHASFQILKEWYEKHQSVNTTVE